MPLTRRQPAPQGPLGALDFLDRAAKLSRRHRVAIIGADLAALFAAYYLKERHDIGDVVIVGRAIPAGVSSRYAAPVSGLAVSLPDLALPMHEAMALWRGLPDRLGPGLVGSAMPHLLLARRPRQCRRRCRLGARW
jgi:glycine/D-amino acid oxidase-like deaminating enzyme